MKNNNRRSFLKKTTLGLGVFGLGGLNAFATNEEDKIDIQELTKKTVYLWDDNSINNGNDPAKRPKLDFFVPKTVGTQKRAAILVCPGGGYGGLTPTEGVPFAELFAAKGMVAAVLSYRVAPNKYPAPYADAVRAMRLLRSMADELNIDPNKIGIIGFSAGGHLASTVATQPDLYKDPQDNLAAKVSARPNRVMLGYPVISFQEFAHVGSVKNLLGDKPSPEMLRQFSNQNQVTSNTPPTFLFHTVNDSVVPVQNSLLFAEACARNNVPFALHIYPKGNHGVGLALNNPELNNWTEIMLKWLIDWQSPLA